MTDNAPTYSARVEKRGESAYVARLHRKTFVFPFYTSPISCTERIARSHVLDYCRRQKIDLGRAYRSE